MINELPQWGTVDRQLLEHFFNGRVGHRTHVVGKMFEAQGIPEGGTILRIRDTSYRTSRGEWIVVGEVYPDGTGYINTYALSRRQVKKLREMFMKLFNFNQNRWESRLSGTRKRCSHLNQEQRSGVSGQDFRAFMSSKWHT